MFDAPAFAEDAAPEAVTAERVARQQVVLQELAELGMRMARAICAEAEAPAEAGRRSAGDLALMFGRVSKAVRMTLALEARLAEGAQAQRIQQATEAAGQRDEALRRQDAERIARIRHRESVRQLVEGAIDFEGPEEAEAQEKLLDELDERLVDQAEDARFRNRPVGEWAAAICQALGVPFDAKFWLGEGGEIEPVAPRCHPEFRHPQSRGEEPPPPDSSAKPWAVKVSAWLGEANDRPPDAGEDHHRAPG